MPQNNQQQSSFIPQDNGYEVMSPIEQQSDCSADCVSQIPCVSGQTCCCVLIKLFLI